MPFVRIIAIHKEEAEKFIILTHINEQHQITDGEWFGYAKVGNEKYPFILPCSSSLGKMELFYNDNERFPTNILTKQIIIGEYFTAFDPPDDEDSDEGRNEYLYQITNIYEY